MSDFSPPGYGTRGDWSHLPSDMRHYLAHFCENITNLHYCMINDADDFFHTILPNIAVRNEALLNAVVGFSAYNITLQNPDGKLSDFLQYYNKSVTLLLNWLKRKEKHNIATLLTILQLATIEVNASWWTITSWHRADLRPGIPWRLGQPDGTSEGSVRDPDATLYTTVGHADTDRPDASCVVRAI